MRLLSQITISNGVLVVSTVILMLPFDHILGSSLGGLVMFRYRGLSMGTLIRFASFSRKKVGVINQYN